MKSNRIIAVLLLQDGWLVQSKLFTRYLRIGNPIDAVKRLSEWGADELIYLDISKGEFNQNFRSDTKSDLKLSVFDLLHEVSQFAFMPMTVGGGIKTLQDIEMRLISGADKVSINSAGINNPDFIASAVNEFGSQCIVASIDYLRSNERELVYDHVNKKTIDLDLNKLILKYESLGVGEIFLNSVEKDGTKQGMDVGVIGKIVDQVNIPVIACGGVGKWQHFEEVLSETDVDAVAAANVFHHIDQSVYLAKKHLFANGFNVRPPELIDVS
jgi:cyclase